jgi:hypothetical protein
VKGLGTVKGRMGSLSHRLIEKLLGAGFDRSARQSRDESIPQ